MGYSIAPIQVEQLLGKLEGVNLAITTDQLISLIPGKKRISRIVFSNASGAISATTGGVYSAISKGGTIYILASQAYAALTGVKVLIPTLNSNFISGDSLYFSLTTASVSARTCDVHVFGEIL